MNTATNHDINWDFNFFNSESPIPESSGLVDPEDPDSSPLSLNHDFEQDAKQLESPQHQNRHENLCSTPTEKYTSEQGIEINPQQDLVYSSSTDHYLSIVSPTTATSPHSKAKHGTTRLDELLRSMDEGNSKWDQSNPEDPFSSVLNIDPALLTLDAAQQQPDVDPIQLLEDITEQQALLQKALEATVSPAPLVSSQKHNLEGSLIDTPISWEWHAYPPDLLDASTNNMQGNAVVGYHQQEFNSQIYNTSDQGHDGLQPEPYLGYQLIEPQEGFIFPHEESLYGPFPDPLYQEPWAQPAFPQQDSLPLYAPPVTEQQRFLGAEAPYNHEEYESDAASEPDSPVVAKKSQRTGTGKIKNKRSKNIATFDPSRHYEPLAGIPQSWGPIHRRRRNHLFRYTKEGELIPSTRYSATEIGTFLSGQANLARQLTLWLQIAPADSKKRYPDPENSSKCRFLDCPVPKGTIEKGEYRVAFDERRGPNTDPFHNAGYVHLFCLEKHLDFPALCKAFTVKADRRKMRHEPKKMTLDKDSESIAQIATSYIKNVVSVGGPVTNYSDTLCCAMTLEKSRIGPKAHKVTREKRGGNNFERHWNNLEWMVANLKSKRRKLGLKNYKKPVPSAQVAQAVRESCAWKRKRCDEEEEEEDHEIVDRPQAKRQKVSESQPSNRPIRRPSRPSMRTQKAESPLMEQESESDSLFVPRRRMSLAPRKAPNPDDDYIPDDQQPARGTKRRRVVNVEDSDDESPVIKLEDENEDSRSRHHKKTKFTELIEVSAPSKKRRSQEDIRKWLKQNR